MKETGVIRRIDELGRIVIPKEVRKKMKIRSGDSIDIFIDNDKIMLEKYSPLKDLQSIVEVLIDSLNKVYNTKICVTDMTKVIYATCNIEKESVLDSSFISLIEKRSKNDINQSNIKLTEKYIIPTSSRVSPILIYGDLFGAILIVECNNKTDEVITLLNSFICNYLES